MSFDDFNMQSEPLAPVDSETRENLEVESADPGVAAFTNDHVQTQQPGMPLGPSSIALNAFVKSGG